MKRRDETPDRCHPLNHTDGMKLGHFLENLVLSAGKKNQVERPSRNVRIGSSSREGDRVARLSLGELSTFVCPAPASGQSSSGDLIRFFFFSVVVVVVFLVFFSLFRFPMLWRRSDPSNRSPTSSSCLVRRAKS